MEIPKTIMQTYSNEDALSPEMLQVIQDWKNKNKDYQHILFYYLLLSTYKIHM